MAYIGKTPSQATRSRFYFTATGGETSLSGADDNGNTLVFSDGNFVDVMLNGVTLVAGTDYDTDTANTIDNLTALTADDVVEIVVYDTFSVFGGDVKGDFNVQNGTLTASTVDLNGGNIDGTTIGGATPAAITGTTVTASGLVTAQDGLVVDNDGATVATFDRATSDGTIVDLQKDGSSVGSIGSVSTDSDATPDLYIGGDNTGIRLGYGADVSAVVPCTGTTGALRNGVTNLGAPNAQFDDLYLSGGVYLGGTGSANKVSYYEEGTYTASLQNSTQTVTAATITGRFQRVGNNVFANAFFTNIDKSGLASSDFIVITLPFAHEGGEIIGSAWVRDVTFGGYVNCAYISNTDTNFVYLWECITGAGTGLIKANDLGTGTSDIGIAIQYHINNDS